MGRPVGGMLLVCHISAADAAIEQAEQLPWHGRRDLLVYGQGAHSFPEPDGWGLIRVPLPHRSVHVVVQLVRQVVEIRRSRYDVVAIGQPELASSRARGVFLALPTLFGSRHGLAVDPGQRRPPWPIRRGRALADLGVWIALQLVSQLLAASVALVVEILVRRCRRSPVPIPESGSVLYLRTDIDIAATGLRAGGSAAHTEGVVRGLRVLGYDVELWSTGEIAGIAADARVPVLQRANVPTEITELISVLPQLRQLSQHAPIEGFVYQRYSLNNLTGLLAARRWRVPLVLEVNASEVHWRAKWSRLRFPRLARATERLLLQLADRVVTVSANAAQELLETGAQPDRMRIVPNGVAVDRFRDAAPAPTPFGPGTVVIGFCGLFYPWHGVPTLAHAFAELAERTPEARLLLVGDGGERPAVEQVIANAGLADRVHLTGLVERDQVPGYMQSADILVSPHADVPGFIGSPIKIFEYMAAGRAIVATRVAQLAEVLVNEATALLVPPDDPPAMARAIRQLVRDPDLRARLGSAAQCEAVERHSWEARLRETLSQSA